MDGIGIEGVTIQFDGMKSFEEQTDEEGAYTHLAPRGTYNLTPYKDDDPTNGVTTFDILLIRQHILNNKVFDSGSQYLAADANLSGSITTFDMVLLSKLILGINNPFGDTNSWIFIAADFKLGDEMPDLAALPFNQNITTSLEVESGFDFYGIKKGDVNGSAKVNSFQQAASRTNAPLSLSIEDQFLQKGKTYSIPFSFPIDQPLAGYQLSIQTAHLDFREINEEIIEVGTFASDKVYSWFCKDRHQINLNWLPKEANNGQFTLTFKVEQSGYLSDLLQLNQRNFVNEGYTADLETMDLQLEFIPATSQNVPLTATLSPNPIRLNHALLTIENKEPTTLLINIYDAQGQVVQSYQEQVEAGQYQKRLTLPDVAGTYWVHLNTSNGERRQLKLLKLR